MKKDKTIIVLFLIIVFGVFAFYPVKYVLLKTNKLNLISSDNWKTYEKSGNRIKDLVMSLETAIDNRTVNYFPFYNDDSLSFAFLT